MKELPPLTPGMQAQVDQLYAAATELLDRYMAGFEVDMNRHAVKHGRMDDERAMFDITRILARDVPANMLAAITALAIVRGIAKKRQGKA